MNVWFGADWGAPICHVTPQVDVPIGLPCLWCKESITPSDSGWGQTADGPWMHVECFVRQMAGSVGHQLKLCPCFGGTYEGEPETLSKRDAARAAWDLVRSRT
jgi:hypothetical protein